MKKLSIIVPCYNEEESVPLFYPAVNKVMDTIPDLEPEYWFINDGSKHLKKLKNYAKKIQNMFTLFLFQETLVRSPHFMPDFKLQLETM